MAPYGRGWRSPNGTEDNVMLGIKHYKNGTIDADKRRYNVSGGLDTSACNHTCILRFALYSIVIGGFLK